MPDFFDRLENRTPAARETALFRDLRKILGIAKPRAPSLRAQLRGVDVATLGKRADLAQIPIIRRADVLKMQAEMPPFGGMSAMRLGGLKQILVERSGLLALEGHAKDWWGMGRALFAAGLRDKTRVINCLPYDLVADGHMVACGVDSLGCPIIPAGSASLYRKIDAIARLRPGFFCGHTDEFSLIINHNDVDASCIKHALLTGNSSKGRRSEYALRKFTARHAFMMPEVGVVAYESDSSDRMVVSEGLIVEIIDPRTSRPVEPGAEGELVVTRLNPDCPILRYATGAMTSQTFEPSECGRTNMRIHAPHDRTPELVDTGGQRVHISDIERIAEHYPTLRRVSLVMRRANGGDELHLRVEPRSSEAIPLEQLMEALHRLTSSRGTIEVLAPGTMSEDDAVIVDERHLH